jgi:hypothetical protein
MKYGGSTKTKHQGSAKRARLTTHSTGARTALISSARLAAYDVVSAPGQFER